MEMYCFVRSIGSIKIKIETFSTKFLEVGLELFTFAAPTGARIEGVARGGEASLHIKSQNYDISLAHKQRQATTNHNKEKRYALTHQYASEKSRPIPTRHVP